MLLPYVSPVLTLRLCDHPGSALMFFSLAILPGLIVLGILGVVILEEERIGWSLGCSVVGCLLAAASPWISIWFVQNVLGDNTANIGAGLLVFAQPVLAPMGAGVGAVVGAVIGGWSGDKEDDERGELPPIA